MFRDNPIRKNFSLLIFCLICSLWCAALQVPENQPAAIRSVEGDGIYFNSVRLLIDGNMVGAGSPRDGDACVFWEDAEARFVFDLGRVMTVTGILIQADDDDDYIIECSSDGISFQPLIIFRGEMGTTGNGLETMSSMPDHPAYLTMPEVPPVEARYIRLYAMGGDGLYGVSELQATAYADEGESVSDSRPFLTPSEILSEGLFSNAVDLIVDGRIPTQGEAANANTCVFWSEENTFFVLDLGEEKEIADLVIQVDGDDHYRIEYSSDGQLYIPLVEIRPADGEIEAGMDTFSSVDGSPDFLPELDFFPIRARYIKVLSLGGEGWFAVSELQLFGPLEIE